MAILVGIDEAGYGPIMGPLVVSAAAISLPDELLGGDLWDSLRGAVARNRKGASGRLLINDSKKLHQGLGDYKHLQRGVLGFLKAAGKQLPETLGDLLGMLKALEVERLGGYPWYETGTAERKLGYDRQDITLAGAGLSSELAKQGGRALGISSTVLLAKEYNQLVAVTNNKAAVLFNLAIGYIDKAYRKYGRNNNLQIVVDKQGGRSHYREHLQKMFPGLKMKILKERDDVSSYQLGDEGRGFKIHFLAKGDSKQMPIALASMASKYLRELMMESLNVFFADVCPGIKPTAGYYQDGKRFLDELTAAGLLAQEWEELLVRQR